MSLGTPFSNSFLQRAAAGFLVMGLVACATPDSAQEPKTTAEVKMTAPEPAPGVAQAPVPTQSAGWSAAMQALYVRLEVDLQPADVSVTKMPGGKMQIVVPSDMSFALGLATVQPALSKVLENIAQGLNNHPAASVLVVGHTDNTGSDSGNQRLSLRRADSVRERLVSLKVDASRITTEGMGSTVPMADNSTLEGRIQNRRIEIVLSE